MQMSTYLATHPEATSGAPPWPGAAVVVATLLIGWLGASAALFWHGEALLGGDAEALPAAFVAGLVSIGLASRIPRNLRRAALLRRLAREGRHCYAVTEEELFVTDERGRALVVELDRITELVLEGDELRLRVDDPEAQGIVYAVVFGCFDEDGPSPGRCFDAVAARLNARQSPARITG